MRFFDKYPVPTYYVEMNVTLAIDDALVERARALAASRGTSLNQMIRELLEEATAATSPAALLAELEDLWETDAGRSSASSRTWTRDELYDRPVLR